MMSLILSYECFAPKTTTAQDTLVSDTVDKIKDIDPAFVSVTCGAGGGQQEGYTFETVKKMNSLLPGAIVPHVLARLTPTGTLAGKAEHYAQMGVKRVVALRGDKADKEHSTVDLVAALRATTDFDVCVSGYPQIHPLASSPQADLDYLKAKVQAGASHILTQFCYDTSALAAFKSRLDDMEVEAPISVGMLMGADPAFIRKLCHQCEVPEPQTLLAKLDGLEQPDREAVLVEHFVDLTSDLVRWGYAGLHIYTLNHAKLSLAFHSGLIDAGLL